MKRFFCCLIISIGLSAHGQNIEIIARLAGLQHPGGLSQSIASRIIFEGNSTSGGIEASLNNWRLVDGTYQTYVSVAPFFSARSSNARTPWYINMGPSISFGYGDVIPEQTNQLDLGIHQTIGFLKGPFIFEYYMRIGFRQYQYKNDESDFSQIGFGVGYRL